MPPLPAPARRGLPVVLTVGSAEQGLSASAPCCGSPVLVLVSSEGRYLVSDFLHLEAVVFTFGGVVHGKRVNRNIISVAFFFSDFFFLGFLWPRLRPSFLLLSSDGKLGRRKLCRLAFPCDAFLQDGSRLINICEDSVIYLLYY